MRVCMCVSVYLGELADASVGGEHKEEVAGDVRDLALLEESSNLNK